MDTLICSTAIDIAGKRRGKLIITLGEDADLRNILVDTCILLRYYIHEVKERNKTSAFVFDTQYSSEAT